VPSYGTIPELPHVAKVQNYRVMIFWLEDDPTDERQSV
jgi:hypothetical protein